MKPIKKIKVLTAAGEILSRHYFQAVRSLMRMQGSRVFLTTPHRMRCMKLTVLT